MTRRVVLTVICDDCGKLSQHKMTSSGFHEQIYVTIPMPRDWTTQKREGGGTLSPVLDFCPLCAEQRKRDCK